MNTNVGGGGKVKKIVTIKHEKRGPPQIIWLKPQGPPPPPQWDNFHIFVHLTKKLQIHEA